MANSFSRFAILIIVFYWSIIGECLVDKDGIMINEESWGAGKKWALDPRSAEARTVGRKAIHSMMRSNIQVRTVNLFENYIMLQQ